MLIRTKLDLDARGLIVLLATVLTAAAVPAFPAEPASRAEALQALVSPDAATRAEAVVWIANRGTIADAELLHQRLRDESGPVRSYAEQGLWLLWSRSGDPRIDAVMAQGGEEMQAGRYAEAIKIFTSVIKAKPQFGALSGMGLVYTKLERYDEALKWFRKALDVNPNMVGVEMNIELLKQKQQKTI